VLSNSLKLGPMDGPCRGELFGRSCSAVAACCEWGKSPVISSASM